MVSRLIKALLQSDNGRDISFAKSCSGNFFVLTRLITLILPAGDDGGGVFIPNIMASSSDELYCDRSLSSAGVSTRGGDGDDAVKGETVLDLIAGDCAGSHDVVLVDFIPSLAS